MREREPRRADDSTRVLLVARDRRFRTVTSALLAQRGCSVSVDDGSEEVPLRAARDRAEVVVLDATSSLTAAAQTAARLQALQPPVGVVAVSGDPHPRLNALAVLPKWGSFDSLYLAVQGARKRGPDA
jgi:DNA-binding NtrC family response regulator